MPQKKQYAVQINNQKELEQLMEYYDKVEWKWAGGQKPKQYNPFNEFKNTTSVFIKLSDKFTWDDKSWTMYETIITLSQAKEKIRHMKAYKDWRKKQIKLPKPEVFKYFGIFEKGDKQLQYFRDSLEKRKTGYKSKSVKLEVGTNHIQKLSDDNTSVQVELPEQESSYRAYTKEEIEFMHPKATQVGHGTYTFTAQYEGVEYDKIKPGDKIWVEVAVLGIDSAGVIINESCSANEVLFTQLKDIKKHIPVKSELEIAEDELENIIAELASIPVATEDTDYVESILDRYYQARKKVEELKNNI